MKPGRPELANSRAGSEMWPTAGQGARLGKQPSREREGAGQTGSTREMSNSRAGGKQQAITGRYGQNREALRGYRKRYRQQGERCQRQGERYWRQGGRGRRQAGREVSALEREISAAEGEEAATATPWAVGREETKAAVVVVRTNREVAAKTTGTGCQGSGRQEREVSRYSTRRPSAIHRLGSDSCPEVTAPATRPHDRERDIKQSRCLIRRPPGPRGTNGMVCQGRDRDGMGTSTEDSPGRETC